MGTFRIDKEFKNKLEKKCQERAKILANETKEKLHEKYISLLDWYYLDYSPQLDKYNEPYYQRTFNLYKSAHKYYMNSHNSIFYGGVDISSVGMLDYPGKNGNGISADGLLNKFIYNSSGTWHGGDWHGGYGTPASLNIYNEMHKYRDELYRNLENRCKIKI